jgi:hypothetical protein
MRKFCCGVELGVAISAKSVVIPAQEYVKESNPGLRLGFFHALAPKNDVCGRAEGKQSYPTTFYSTGEMLRKDFFTGSQAGTQPTNSVEAVASKRAASTRRRSPTAHGM